MIMYIIIFFFVSDNKILSVKFTQTINIMGGLNFLNNRVYEKHKKRENLRYTNFRQNRLKFFVVVTYDIMF